MSLVLNWAWQGTALAVITLAVLARARRVSATTRYRLLWIGLGAVLAIPVLPQLPAFAAAAPVAAVAIPPPVPALDLPLLPGPSRLPAIALTVWALWSLFWLLRLGSAVSSLRRLRRSARPFPAAREQRLTHWLGVRHRGRIATLVVSDAVTAVSVLGLGSPLIAVAPHVLDTLDDAELDHVLLHEWAHVQRRDDVARLVQGLVRAVAGLHPGVWALDRRLDLEREVACDDRAVNATGDPRHLARCLTRLAQVTAPPVLSLAPGALSVSPLTTRVLRLLDSGRNRSTAIAPMALGLGAPAIITLAAALGCMEVVVSASPGTPVMIQRTYASPAPLGVTAGHGADALFDTPPRSPSGAARTPVIRGGAIASRQTPAAPAPAGPAVAVHAPALTRLARRPWAPPLAAPGPGAATTSPAMAGLIRITPAADGDAPDDAASPWASAADAGVAVGKGSQKAGTATARFFTSFGKRIAGRF